MGQIVSLASFKNDRRAAAELARREAAHEERLEQKRHELANTLGGSFDAHVMADIIVDVMEERRAAERPSFSPAYCDPHNERRGAKYDATRGLSTTEIAARIRQDIAEAKRRHEIDRKVTVSVRTQYYAGGSSIDVRVTALPAGFKVLSPAALECLARGEETGPWVDRRSDELKALLAALTAIHGAYNRDNSDSSVDYFDTRYQGGVDLDWRVRSHMEKAEVLYVKHVLVPEQQSLLSG